MISKIKKLGPGLLFAGAAIGVSHLVQSTRAGADFSFGLLWALVLTNLFKYPFFLFGPKYSVATSESLLDGYFKLGKFVLIIYLVLSLITMFTIQSAVTIVTAGLAIELFGITSNITIWALFIFVIGVKLFPDKQTKVSFKKVLTAVGFAHAPGLLRFFALTPDLMIPIIFLTQFWIFAGLIISTKQILNLKSGFKSFGIVFLSFLIIAFLSISFVMSRMNALPINNI